MDSKTRKKLERMGGRETTVKEFLGMSDAEAAIVEMRLQLADAVRKRRAASGITQADLAKAIGSSQARVAKMEGGDPQASLESLVRALVATGGKAHLKLSGRVTAGRRGLKPSRATSFDDNNARRRAAAKSA